MGLILPSGCMKANIGSQVASDTGLGISSPVYTRGVQYLQPRSNHRLPSHRQSSLRVRLPLLDWQRSLRLYARPHCR